MSPVDRIETFLSNAAGHGDELPEPITRKEIYFKEICERIAAGVTPEQIQAAVDEYLNEHGINQLEAATMQEFLEVLNS